jgi:hypothetical protein
MAPLEEVVAFSVTEDAEQGSSSWLVNSPGLGQLLTRLTGEQPDKAFLVSRVRSINEVLDGIEEDDQ